MTVKSNFFIDKTGYYTIHILFILTLYFAGESLTPEIYFTTSLWNYVWFLGCEQILVW